jgi:hypothetical protein
LGAEARRINTMIRILPVFKGYTVDARLGQFRKVFKSRKIEFLEFDSERGYGLLMQYIETLDVNSEDFKTIARNIF